MHRHLPILPALTALALALPAPAQEAGEFAKAFKIRTGYGLSTKDNLRASDIGVGFEVSYGLAAGRIGLEAGWFYKDGDQFIKPVDGQAPSPLSPVNLDASGDSRKNTLEGFSVRLSFTQDFLQDWSWQAGLMLGGTRFKHEYVGDVQGADWHATNADSWRDLYYGTPSEGGIKVSPYLGVAWRVGDHSSLEFNALFLNYSALDYVHHPGTASSYALDSNPYSDSTVGRISQDNAFPLDTLEKKNRLIPTLEFAYVFHF